MRLTTVLLKKKQVHVKDDCKSQKKHPKKTKNKLVLAGILAVLWTILDNVWS